MQFAEGHLFLMLTYVFCAHTDKVNSEGNNLVHTAVQWSGQGILQPFGRLLAKMLPKPLATLTTLEGVRIRPSSLHPNGRVGKTSYSICQLVLQRFLARP